VTLMNEPCSICEVRHRTDRKKRVCIVEHEFIEWIDYACSMPRGSGIGIVEQYERFQNHTQPRYFWWSISYGIARRDGHKCVDCGEKTSSPEIHHIKPRSRGGLDNPDNLVTLCPRCHRKYTSQLVRRKEKNGEVWNNPMGIIQRCLEDATK
jgi:hypothetical protein